MTSVYCIGQSIVSPLGDTVEKVLSAVLEGRAEHSFSREGFNGHSFFEAIALEAARKALDRVEITPRTGLVLSTAKGNVEFIGKEDISLALSARVIADSLGIATTPLVVSNACISGVAALLQGMRMIRSGEYDTVVVVGAEVQSDFIRSGFGCLKAVSDEPCRPFDIERKGLNLGEAAAAIILSGHKSGEDCYELVTGAVRNDANHISGPSRTGEGSYKCLRYVLRYANKEDIAFINVHGTATPYNDEMESIALSRAGLSDLPVNALKGNFGHTMGAAGVVESVVSMAALDRSLVLPTLGFSTLGVSCPVGVSPHVRTANGNSFIKLLSGFGGVNAAMLFRKGGGR